MKQFKQDTIQYLLTQPENLFSAWTKLRKYYGEEGIWTEEIELSDFEANLEEELDIIARQFVNLRYQMHPLKLMAYPKRGDTIEEIVARQSFWVDVRDQVAWIAFVNVVGPWLDALMPSWSYGHRLHRNVWVEEEEVNGKIKRQLKFGWYRSSSGLLYRRFQHSWPLFRRHVLLTARRMGHVWDVVSLENAEERVWEEEQSLPLQYRLPYLTEGFWGENRTSKRRDIYWASIDLEKFYPSISLQTIYSNFQIYSPPQFRSEIGQILRHLLRFPLDLSGWSLDSLKLLVLKIGQKKLNGIPTGLAVAGFLANIGLLKVDQAVDRTLQSEERFCSRVAHFRYVDDHIFLSTDYDTLIAWIHHYESLLCNHGKNCTVKWRKTQPKELQSVLGGKKPGKNQRAWDRKVSNSKKKCQIDPAYPTPLMTETLALVSRIAETRFMLLNEEEQAHFMQEIQHLLLTEFPDEEIRRDTRMSFAASKIARWAPGMRYDPDGDKLVSKQREIFYIEKELSLLRGIFEDCREGSFKTSNLKHDIEKKESSLSQLRKDVAQLGEKWKENRSQNGMSFFRLLLKAVQEYWEKPRLWLRLLEYYRRSGYGGINQISRELEEVGRINPLTCGYLRAYLMQELANNLLSCAHTLLSRDRSQEEKYIAERFMIDVLDFPLLLREHSKRFYEHHAVDLFENSVGTARQMLKNSDVQVSKKVVDHLEEYQKKKSGIDWDKKPADWARSTGHAVESWALWAENRVTKPLDNEPGCIWNAVARTLDKKHAETWHLLSRYPARLPSEVIDELLTTRFQQGGRMYLKEGRGGWIYDALWGRYKYSQGVAGAPRIIRSVLRNMEPISGYISLCEWVGWTKKRFEKEPHDPRVGEWTALEIVKQLTNCFRNIENVKKWKEHLRSLVNPYNICIPQGWAEHSEILVTWEKWHYLVHSKSHGEQISIIPKYWLTDSRYTPYWDLNPKSDIEWAPIHGLGLILLGLLRRSFEWPPVWNQVGGRRSRLWLVTSMINRVVCSSFTLAILEACLLLRPKESILIQSSFQVPPPDDDTTFDPPQITNLEELGTFLDKAERVLEGYQLSIHKHLPRQLTPINLRQLSRPSQFDEVEDE